MEIEYKEFSGSKPRIGTLSSLVTSKTYDFDSSELDSINSKAQASIDFTEKVVELLYNKGILNDKDIASLVSKIIICDEDDVKVVKD